MAVKGTLKDSIGNELLIGQNQVEGLEETLANSGVYRHKITIRDSEMTEYHLSLYTSTNQKFKTINEWSSQVRTEEYMFCHCRHDAHGELLGVLVKRNGSLYQFIGHDIGNDGQTEGITYRYYTIEDITALPTFYDDVQKV